MYKNRIVDVELIKKDIDDLSQEDSDLFENVIDGLTALKTMKYFKDNSLSKKIDKNIYSLKVKSIRILYSIINDNVVCLVYLKKQKNKIGQHNINIANQRLKKIK